MGYFIGRLRPTVLVNHVFRVVGSVNGAFRSSTIIAVLRYLAEVSLIRVNVVSMEVVCIGYVVHSGLHGIFVLLFFTLFLRPLSIRYSFLISHLFRLLRSVMRHCIKEVFVIRVEESERVSFFRMLSLSSLHVIEANMFYFITFWSVFIHLRTYSPKSKAKRVPSIVCVRKRYLGIAAISFLISVIDGLQAIGVKDF